MSIIDLFNKFQTQEQAIYYLEKKRWKGKPICPYCGSESVGKHTSPDRKGIRWQCRKCTKAFAATVGTIFHGTHIPLRNWFLLIGLMLNAKKSASSYQIARDLGMRRPTVWSMMHRVRVAMAKDPKQSTLLYGIVEADETFIGGKPRRFNRRADENRYITGRPRRKTTKKPVVGAIERGGRVIARPVDKRDLGMKGLGRFIDKFVEKPGAIVITDEWPGYDRLMYTRMHTRINHSIEYANGQVHTNSIEGFWALLKRAHYGQHHHYSKKYISLYVAEACYKYNRRFGPVDFDDAIGLMATA